MLAVALSKRIVGVDLAQLEILCVGLNTRVAHSKL